MDAKATRIGFISTGLDTYWGQFDGLLDHLAAYGRTIVSHIEGNGDVIVTDAGFVDSPEKAREAGRKLRAACVDLRPLHDVRGEGRACSASSLPRQAGQGPFDPDDGEEAGRSLWNPCRYC